MELTTDQKNALEIILDRYEDKEKFVTIAGYAGTGKSTLVRFAVSALQNDPKRVAYATFTGKAAEVLRKKGNQGAITLHKLLYDSRPLPQGGFARTPKKSLDYDLVVVDECSMVPVDMVEMLFNHKVFIIFIGDPFQLPTLRKKDDNHLLERPHVFLSKIMRQAAESEIIRVTMDIREGKPLRPQSGEEVMIIKKKDLVTGHLTWADQIICATNATRQKLNKTVRELHNYSGPPQDGEKVICLTNYWEDINSEGSALVNGTTGIIKKPYESFKTIPYWVRNGDTTIHTIVGDFYPEEDEPFLNVSMDKQMFIDEEPSLTWKEAYRLRKKRNLIPKEFTYAYAITCWKAQGSEWDKVLVLEEGHPFDREEHARYLYTAATRAIKKLVIVLK